MARPSAWTHVPILAAIGATLALSSGRAAFGLEVRSSTPGNVFVDGEPLTFRAIAALGERLPQSLAVVDYAGQAVAQVIPEASMCLVPLPDGYYELRVGDAKLTSFAVVRRPEGRVPGDCPIGAATSLSELIPPEHYAEAAEIVRRTSVRWVREGFTWLAMEPERGRLDWGKYDRLVDEVSRHGISIYALIYATPQWARSDRDWKAYPDDLRDAYEFARAAARHFRGRVQAWEAWNEADTAPYANPLADEYAAFGKAAGLRIGLNTSRHEGGLDVRNIEAVQFGQR